MVRMKENRIHCKIRSTAILILSVLIFSSCQAMIPAPFLPPTPLPSPSATGPANPSILHMAIGEWPPYTGKNLPHFGCDAWVVTEAFAQEGITVTYDFFPWARALDLSRNGDWDGTMEWDNSPALRADFFVSQDFLSAQEWVFFSHVDRPFSWRTPDDLSGKVVGLTSGYTYSSVFENLRRKGNIHFEEASSDQANFRKLLMGRIDVFPIERNVGLVLLNQNFTPEERNKITYDPHPIKDFHPHVFLSRANPANEDRIERFNRGFQQLKDSGRYAEIIKECGP